MNTKRVLIAGLLAGLVLNIGEAALHGVVIAEPTESALAALGHPVTGDPFKLTMLVLMTFGQGIVGMWLYAAIGGRARRHAALIVGNVLWFLSAAYAAIYLDAGFPGVFPANVVWWPVIWGWVEFPLAMLAGAAVYRD
ncbi:MAG: hypothetical protein ABI995_00340 [Acidobacteriota bacterium]